jgi:hypothetical protein
MKTAYGTRTLPTDGAYQSVNGLTVSRVLEGSNIRFQNPSYNPEVCHTGSKDSAANVASSSASPLSNGGAAASSSSASPIISDSESSQSHHQIVNEFAKRVVNGQVLMFPTRAKERKPAKRSNKRLKPLVEGVLPDPDPLPLPERYKLQALPKDIRLAIISGAGNQISGGWPFDSNTCVLFDPTCSNNVVIDSLAVGVCPPATPHNNGFVTLRLVTSDNVYIWLHKAVFSLRALHLRLRCACVPFRCSCIP